MENRNNVPVPLPFDRAGRPQIVVVGNGLERTDDSGGSPVDAGKSWDAMVESLKDPDCIAHRDSDLQSMAAVLEQYEAGLQEKTRRRDVLQGEIAGLDEKISDAHAAVMAGLEALHQAQDALRGPDYRASFFFFFGFRLFGAGFLLHGTSPGFGSADGGCIVPRKNRSPQTEGARPSSRCV